MRAGRALVSDLDAGYRPRRRRRGERAQIPVIAPSPSSVIHAKAFNDIRDPSWTRALVARDVRRHDRAEQPEVEGPSTRQRDVTLATPLAVARRIAVTGGATRRFPHEIARALDDLRGFERSNGVAPGWDGHRGARAQRGTDHPDYDGGRPGSHPVHAGVSLAEQRAGCAPAARPVFGERPPASVTGHPRRPAAP
jgi:hypothetical protein